MDGHRIDDSASEFVKLEFWQQPPGWTAVRSPRRRQPGWRLEVERERAVHIGGKMRRWLTMYLQTSLTDPNESTFPILRAPHCDPPITSRQASRLERDDSYALPLLRGDVDRIHDSLDDDIDAIGICGADVVAELGVAIGQWR